ncbi:MAG: 30S processome protein Utp24 [Desulfurococcales archaeon]|nr:30S processome protein Utp24 [Desulfurococcales archaeon]
MEASRLGNTKRIALLDTNTLIYMAQGLIPPSTLLEEAGYPRLATTSRVVEELEKISTLGKPSTSRAAKAALKLLHRLDIEVLEWTGAGDADDSLEAVALQLKHSGVSVIVATSDKTLRSRLRLHGIPTLYYRESRGGVELEWEPL